MYTPKPNNNFFLLGASLEGLEMAFELLLKGYGDEDLFYDYLGKLLRGMFCNLPVLRKVWID